MGTYFLIKEPKTNLNIVGVTKQLGDKIDFIVVTVMIKKDFKPRPGNYIITI
jgi:hypothetical protein